MGMGLGSSGVWIVEMMSVGGGREAGRGRPGGRGASPECGWRLRTVCEPTRSSLTRPAVCKMRLAASDRSMRLRQYQSSFPAVCYQPTQGHRAGLNEPPQHERIA